MSKFVDRVKGPMQESVVGLPEPRVSLVAQYMGQEPSADDGHELPADGTRAAATIDPRGVRPADEREPTRVEQPNERTVAEPTQDYTKVGEHVASMLESARAAAVKIQQEANEDARRIADRSRADAAEVLADARSRASRLEAEAAQLRAEAAEALSRAQHMVGEQSRAAEGRRTALETNVTLAEERLGQLVSALRELATRLEDVLERRPPTAAEGAGSATGSAIEPLRNGSTPGPVSRRPRRNQKKPAKGT